MKLAYIDLSYGTETLSIAPSKYGGASRVPTLLREKTDFCWNVAQKESFEDILPTEKKNKCIEITKDQTDRLYKGESVLSVLPELKDFDIIFHNSPKIFLNLKGIKAKQLVWAVGFDDEVDYRHENLVLHNTVGQQPKLQNPSVRIHEFILGIDLPEFQEYEKDDFLVQITNHYPQINSAVTAQFCLRNKIKCIFGGPIAENYQYFKNYIDNKYTFYRGVIKEEEKIELLKKAKAHVTLYGHPINETPLCVKQALAYGCFIICTPTGHLNYSIRNGINGFFVQSEEEFLNAWVSRNSIKQRSCYDSVVKYSVENMIASLSVIFKNLLSKNY